MTKIVILNNDLDLGGIQRSLIDFLKFLSSNKSYEVHLILWQRGGVLLDEVPESTNIYFYDYPETLRKILAKRNNHLKFQKLLRYFTFKFYQSIVRKPWLFYQPLNQNFDIAISYSQNGYPLFYTIDRILSKKKYLWYHHGCYEIRGRSHILNMKYYQKFDKLVTVSQANKDMLISYFNDLKEKFIVVPNILDVGNIISKANERIDSFKSEEKSFHFVTVSRFSREKGIDLAIAIASELKVKGVNFRWYFIGDGELFFEIKKMIKDRNLENECFLLGNLINPYPYMKEADLYIQTSYVESQSLTVCEALVLKKIIVTTKLPVLSEVLKFGRLGVLCDANVESFTKEIIKVLGSSALQTSFSHALELENISNDYTYQELRKIL